MRDRRMLTGLKVFLLYCALLAMAGPAVFWAARLGMQVPPSRVQGFVGYFWDAGGTRLSHVAIPLEGERDLFLDGAEVSDVSDVIAAGMRIEKRRGELAVRIDSEPARWPLHPSHVALALGGCLALAGLGWSVARSRSTRLESLAWLAAPTRLAVWLAPGLVTVLTGVGVAFARGELDRVFAAATLGVAALAAAAGTQGGWQRLRERAVLARAHRLAARATGAVSCVRGTVRRVADDVVELAVEGGGIAQAELKTSARLGLGALPHAPIAVGDRLELIGGVEHVVDVRGEHLARETAMARRLFAAGHRPLLIVAAI